MLAWLLRIFREPSPPFNTWLEEHRRRTGYAYPHDAGTPHRDGNLLICESPRGLYNLTPRGWVHLDTGKTWPRLVSG